MIQELRCDSMRWMWDAAFSADSEYIFTGNNLKRKFNYKYIDGFLNEEFSYSILMLKKKLQTF